MSALLSSLGFDSESVSAGSSASVETSAQEVRRGSTEERALVLLGQKIPPESVAAALGVSPSRISQLLSQEEFAAKVATLRYENLQKHNQRDTTYDSLEDKLLDKLSKSLPLMFRPIEILKAIQVINGAKRRGQSAPESVVNQQTIVNLVLPTQITQKFTVNVNNQVISAGEQNLLTMQSGNLLKRIESSSATGKDLIERKEDSNGKSERSERKEDSANPATITNSISRK